ncbi:MAG: hypothetical protein ACT6T0_09400 [Nevskia sp.]|uniref:hypothetical protein n=1 Tax=Nevskia sp. TaxID=1929292 RepID=UPI00403690EC
MSTIRFDRDALLHFYDDRNTKHFEPLNPKGHVSGITGLIGEPLLLDLLCQCLRKKAETSDARLLDEIPREIAPGRRKLDGWIASDNARTLFQVEIKNWSAHSLGGHDLPAAMDRDACVSEARCRYDEYFAPDGTLPTSAEKVFAKCARPALPTDKTLRIEPVLCFWHAVSSDGAEPLSTAKSCGRTLMVFSGSLYLRQLDSHTVEVESRLLADRLQLLKSIWNP